MSSAFDNIWDSSNNPPEVPVEKVTEKSSDLFHSNHSSDMEEMEDGHQMSLEDLPIKKSIFHQNDENKGIFDEKNGPFDKNDDLFSKKGGLFTEKTGVFEKTEEIGTILALQL